MLLKKSAKRLKIMINKNIGADINGVININKEKGFTSHDVVAIVRKTLGYVKAGHTGTLDPNATGVLPVCLGKATKIASYLTDGTKRYRAEVILGISTDSEDITGTVVRKQDVNVSEEEVSAVVSRFVGEYWQTPPMYSAVKVDGKKLYELARQGKTIERAPRLMNIHSIDILEFDLKNNRFIIDVLCSKGTYIRTLCCDIGEKLNTCACMGELQRTAAGTFTLENSITLSELKEHVAKHGADGFGEIITPIVNALPLRKAVVKDDYHKALYNGNKLPFCAVDDEYNISPGEKLFLTDSFGQLIGIYEVLAEVIKPLTML